MNEKEKKDQESEEVDKAADDSDIIDLVDEVPPDASDVQSDIVELSQKVGSDAPSDTDTSTPVAKSAETTIVLTDQVAEEEEIVNLETVLKEPIGYDSGIIEITESDLIEDTDIGKAIAVGLTEPAVPLDTEAAASGDDSDLDDDFLSELDLESTDSDGEETSEEEISLEEIAEDTEDEELLLDLEDFRLVFRNGWIL